MKIELSDKYILKSNTKCFYIAEKAKHKNSNTGEIEEVEKPVAYYVDFHQMIEGLARMKVLESNATSFAELKADLEKIRAEIQAIRQEFEFTVVKGIKTGATDKRGEA